MNGPLKPSLSCILCSGQSGAEVGALVASERLGLSSGGYAPLGYLTSVGLKRGALRDRFGLSMSCTTSLVDCLISNIRGSHGVLVFMPKGAGKGITLTNFICARWGKPMAVIDPFSPAATFDLEKFLANASIEVLTVTGQMESKAPGIAAKVAEVMVQSITSLGERDQAS